MTRATPRLLIASLYAVCVVPSLYAGARVSRVIATGLAGHPGVCFIVLLSMALVIWVAGSAIEDRLLWHGRFSHTRDLPRWIDRYKSNLLRSAAPSPLSLGFALGLLSQIVL